VVKFADGKKPKEDPWQQMQMYRHGGPMGGAHHMGGPPQQQRMMYPYGQQPLGMPQHSGGGYPGPQGPPYGGGAPRYGYPQGPGGLAGGGGGGGGYYPQDGPEPKRSPPYGADGQLNKSPTEGEFGGSGRGDAYDSGLDVMPPGAGPPGAHAPQYSLDSDTQHVRPPEGRPPHYPVTAFKPRDSRCALCCVCYRPLGRQPFHLPPAQRPHRRGPGHPLRALRQRDLREGVRRQEDLRLQGFR
jgi:hypothetical protein